MMTSNVLRLCAVSVVTSFATGCGSVTAPVLPPPETLTVPNVTAHATAGALLAEKSNIATAAGATALVTAGVGAALLVPAALYAGTIAQEPRQEGDKWIWETSFPSLGLRASLYGWNEDDGTHYEMHVTGETPALFFIHDFVWYTGKQTTTSGEWNVFDPTSLLTSRPKTPVVHVTWTIVNNVDKYFTFTNTRDGSLKKGDSVAYALTTGSARMTLHDEHAGFHDELAANDLLVDMNTQTGAGKMVNRGVSYCWDTFEHGQSNIDCPAADPATVP